MEDLNKKSNNEEKVRNKYVLVYMLLWVIPLILLALK